MKFAPLALALALAAVVIFFCNLYAHIWNGAIIYLPLLFATFPTFAATAATRPLKRKKTAR